MRGSVAVHNFLLEHEIPHEFFRPDDQTRDANDLPLVLGVDPETCVRVHAFEAPDGPIVTVTPFTVEPEPDLIAESAGVAWVRQSSPAAVSRITGYPAEWAPPLAHQRRARVLIDKGLCEQDVLYAAGGEPGLILKLRGEDLCRATGGRVALLGHPDTPL